MANIMELFQQIEAARGAGAGPISYIVVGLGNPGQEYRETRHNVGFRLIDAIAEGHSVSIDRAKFKALCAEATIAGVRVLLMKPQTYMNASGEAVREAAAFYKIPNERIIVISDDISLEPGRIRVRKTGSAGGHNGLKSLIRELPGEDFLRLRIGVGAKPHPAYDLADWVLGVPSPDAKKQIAAAFPAAEEGLSLLLGGNYEEAVRLCNGFRLPTTSEAGER